MINTYSQLSEFFKKYKPEKKFTKLLNKKNELKTIIGFYILGYNIMSGIKNFSTNRYFVDSININILPSEKKLILVKNELLKKFKIKNNDEKKLMSLLIKKINFQIKKFKSNKISKLYKKKIKPISKKQYNFFENNGYLVIENAININLLKKLLNTIVTIANKEKKIKHLFYMVLVGYKEYII